MDKALSNAHHQLGPKMTPAMVKGTCDLAQQRLAPSLADGIEISRNQAYGPHERHLLDIFTGSPDKVNKPVLIFVHGGGFVSGDRQMMQGFPFYDNIGQWAAQNGYIGVTMTYRLAPTYTWPAGAEDVATAIDWLNTNIGRFGGDPSRLFVMGQSAGSVHVADYLARPETAGHAASHIAGAILLSCLYDVGSAERNKMQLAYFGEDTSRWSDYAALPGLLETKVPLLCAVAEMDIPDFQQQAAKFVTAWMARHQTYAPILRLSGHNHLSTILQLGAQDDNLGTELRLFIERNQPES